MASRPNSLEPISAIPSITSPSVASDTTGTTASMADMARHGSRSFSGFSVCQPALGAPLQWLPAIGTPELDDMINALLPGPASIQDKRAHISMDFFEYSRQTGENIKFYAVPTGSFTPVTASPASSTLYDSGYGSSLNQSPVISDQSSWTQSPASFGPSTDAAAKSRSSTSKKFSSSSSRPHTMDFANHPGMRILTKDGRDVTNSASRGCKTKEQRDHAHLMRIIKACDSCRRKKVRCDPSHRKRNASQASAASQAELKPAKKPKKAEGPPPVALVGATTDFLGGHAFDAPETASSFPSFDTDFPQDFEEFWNDFVAFDQEPIAVAAADDFVFDSFTDPLGFVSPSSGSSSTSPSQTFTPFTPAAPGTSPKASDLVVDVAGEISLQDQNDPAVPYLNPGIVHGTNYVDFNLYSPVPDFLDEDPVFQLRDLASGQQPTLSDHVATHAGLFTGVSSATGSVFNMASVREESRNERQSVVLGYLGDAIAAAPTGVSGTADNLSWYSEPASSVHVQDGSGIHSPSSRKRPLPDRARVIDVGATGETVNASSVQPPPTSSRPSVCSSALVCGDATSTVSAGVLQSSVSPGTSARPRRVSAAVDGPSSPTSSIVTSGEANSGALDSAATSWAPSATSSRHESSPLETCTTSPVVSGQNHNRLIGDAVVACASTQLLTDAKCKSSAHLDGQHAVLGADLATIFISTLPIRRFLAVKDEKNGATGPLPPSPLFQLAVFGLVSFLCASVLQTHLASQVSLVNILAITMISLAQFAPRCPGPSSVTPVASRHLPIPTPSGIIDTVKSKIRAVNRNLWALRCSTSQRVRTSIPRLTSGRTLRF
ncbi:hypothetical protein VTK56DRAFT_8354 [Thermocarpiscus australiensis]